MNELVQNISASAPVTPVGFKAAPPPAREPSKDDTDAQQQEQDDRASREELAASIDRLAEKAFSNSRLAIEKHEGADLFVYRLIDSSNGSVVRQWPTEDFLSLREYLRTKQGGLVDQRV
ncbi:flagellar protein FlaG [Hyphobacterium sp.]|uniref:flagellar protein FlaG n=1 Tax=Hyphobacterium sp. TaxID=2004662 RepID=UPI003BA89984